jgi:hypothetical protein
LRGELAVLSPFPGKPKGMHWRGLVIDTVVCLTLAKWETVSGQFGGYLTQAVLASTIMPTASEKMPIIARRFAIALGSQREPKYLIREE